MKRLVLLLILTIILSSAISSLVKAQPQETIGPFDKEELLLLTKRISTLGPRVIGYDGYYRTLKFIKDYIKELGLEAEVQKFKAIVPYDEGSYVEIITPEGIIKVKAYALWPNLIQPCTTSPRGIEGPLVYVGKGEDEVLRKVDVRGSIVVIDFDSGDRWIDLFNFGAQAVIFIGSQVSKYEALKKMLLSPLYTPRLYVAPEDTSLLLEACRKGYRARVHVKMKWKEIEAENLVVKIPGESENDVIVVATHVDTWCITPRLAVGADEASNIASLLLLIKYYLENKPKRSLWFAFLSGKWVGLVGPREFVEHYYFSPEVQGDEVKIWMTIGLDLASDNDIIAVTYIGHFYKYGSAVTPSEIAGKFSWVGSVIRYRALERAIEYGMSEDSIYYYSLSYVYAFAASIDPFILVTEPALIAGNIAFTIITKHTRRLYWGTTEDTFDKVNIDNIHKQLILSWLIIDELVNSEDWGITWLITKPVRARLYGKGGAAGFVTIRGRVVAFNVTIGWYSNIPNAIIRMGPLAYATGTYVAAGAGVAMAVTGLTTMNCFPFANIYVKCDENGYFEVHGLPVFLPVYAEAWVLKDAPSHIVYAPDQGIYGMRVIPPAITPLTPYENLTVPVFECSTVELYDVFDPKTCRRTVVLDPSSSGDLFYFRSLGRVMPYNIKEYAEIPFYGHFYNPIERVALVFVPPRVRFLIVLRRGMIVARNVGVIANCSEENPEGVGYMFYKSGQLLRINMTAYHFAHDTYLIVKNRFEMLSSKFVSSLAALSTLEYADKYIREAQNYLERGDYVSAYYKALAAWGWVADAYDFVMALIYDLTGTTVIFLALIVPFAVCLERLLFHATGKARWGITIAIAGISVTLFSLVHPAFSIMSNSALCLGGILVFAFLVFALMVFFSETSNILKEAAVKKLGRHFFEAAAMGSAVFFTFMAPENMRRYRLRTSLTLATLIITIIALASLTSVSVTVITPQKIAMPSAAYTGMLVKIRRSTPPYEVFDVYTCSLLKGVLGEGYVVAPRFCIVPPRKHPEGYVVPLKAGENIAFVRGVMGLTPYESQLLFKDKIVGEPFDEDDYYECIISDMVRESLNVTIGDIIEWHGLKLRVKGVIPAHVVKIDDLDGLPIAPLDPMTIPQYAPAGMRARVAMPLSWPQVLFIPARLAKDLGAYVANIAVYPLDEEALANIRAKAMEIARLMEAPTYIAKEGEPSIGFSKVTTWALFGWGLVTAVIVIAALNMIITLIAAVRERRRDIYVYSAVGLSPRGAATIFLTEGLVYASIAIIVGYLAGVGMNYVLYIAGVLPSIYTLNYSSMAVALVLLASFLIIISSSIYPTLIASKLITPSLERRWKIPTKPKGDLWEIPLPLSVTSLDEALGVLEYVQEYLSGAGRETRFFSVHKLSPVDYTEKSLSFVVGLAPREAHVTQEVRLVTRYMPESKRYAYVLHLRRLTGSYTTWRSSNYFFIDAMRKQLLLWRSLSERERGRYIKQVRKRLSSLKLQSS